MSDVLIRNVPEEVISAIDARAAGLGLSRNEYLRRRLRQDAQSSGRPVDVSDLRRVGQLFADLNAPEIMSKAWS